MFSRIQKTVIFTALAFAGCISIPVVALVFVNWHAIAFGVVLSNIEVGGKAQKTATALLDEKITRFQETKIILTFGEKKWETTPREMGVTVHRDTTVENAYALGRKGTIRERLRDQTAAALFGIRLPAEASIDQELFDAFFRAHLEPEEQKARDAMLVFDEKNEVFAVSDEEAGEVIDASRLRFDLLSSAKTLTPESIHIYTVKDIPSLRKDMVDPLLARANDMLSRVPFLLVRTSEKIVPGRSPIAWQTKIEKTALKDFLKARREGKEAVLDVDERELETFLVQLAPSFNTKPQNAVLAVENGKVTEFSLSQKGVILDVASSVNTVKEALLAQKQSAELAVHTLLPEVRTETIEHLGLISLLGVGESDFRGSPSSRVFNVKLGAQKLNGVLIKPQEEFSFLDTVGEIDGKEGWQAGLVIKGKELVPEYGGGVCQVSTTMFRAAVFAGLLITERFGHSLPVVYYNPQGFDATVYSPHPDLRFVNDTPSNILVQTKVQGTKLIFEFYGTPDGREVKVNGPREYDKKLDGSLKAELVREIYKDGQLAKKDVFRTTYRSPKTETQQRNPLE